MGAAGNANLFSLDDGAGNVGLSINSNWDVVLEGESQTFPISPANANDWTKVSVSVM